MRLHALLALTAPLVPAALAVFADDAYRIDYHHALLGLPQQHTTFFQQPYSGSRASLIYTLSKQFILGAVNPKDGSLVWRQSLNGNASEAYLRAGEDQDVIISAVGKEITAWSASDGRVAWANKFGDGNVQDLEILELADSATSIGAKDAIVLFGGSSPVVRRLDGKRGTVKWDYEDNSGDEPFQVSASATTIYYISLHKTLLGGVKVKVTFLDPLTGHKSDQYTLNSESEVSASESILFVGANSASPILAWTDKSHKVLKVNIIGSKGVHTFNIENTSGEDIRVITVHAPHRITSVPHFLVQYQTENYHWAEVYHIDLVASTITKAYSLPRLAGKGVFSTSTSDANVYFARITITEMIVVSSASHGVLGRWTIDSFAVPGLVEKPDPVHAISEVVPRTGSTYAVRSAVLLSSGDWVLIRNGEPSWVRPEALAGTVTAIWADIAEEEDLAHQLKIEGHENILSAYTHRVKRHINDLRHLPAWLGAIPSRIMNAFIGGDAVSHAKEAQKDSFGFQKFVVLATDNGRLVVLDTGNFGKAVYNTKLAAGTGDEQHELPKLSINEEGQMVVAHELSRQHFNIELTPGQPVRLANPRYISDKDVRQSKRVSSDLIEGELRGFLGSRDSRSPIWRFRPAKDERIVSVTARPAEDPVASIAKVLGDRRVLYKYLNPNLVLVTAVTDATSSLHVHLLDSVSGALLYSASHNGVDTTATVASAVSENWFVYSFALDSTASPSRGYELVVAELYESNIPNDRGPLGAASNYSSLQLSSVLSEDAKPHVVSQTYHIPEEVSHMAVTQTRQGITSRQLLVTLPKSNSIVGVPRNIIDPRRPVGRDPTAAEAAEGLVRYTPVIEFDPKWYLNHKREVMGIKKIITTPALLESTSLVFAYGLDVFGTRVSPSFTFDVLGKDFNKLQMLTTLAALAAAVLFVAPIVRRKQINTLWQV